MNLTEAITEAHKHRKGPFIKGKLTKELNMAIINHGQEYEPAICPPDISRGPAGSCFDTCLINVTFTSKYQYVEGKATSPETGEWIYHSWLTDGTHAFDPTWKKFKRGKEVPAASRYIGIPIPNAFVMFFVQETQYSGVLANREKHPLAVDKMLIVRRREVMEELTP